MKTALGRNFWLFRIGQIVSIIGDSCGSIALAWWILETTGSAAKMSSVLAPAMFIRIFLLPLFGPIGDKYSRKWLAVASDVLRGMFMLGLATMAYAKVFHLPLIITLYILSSIGTALFNAVAGSLIIEIIPREHLDKATRQSQAINAAGGVIGGVAGGSLVTFAGISGAFFIDSLSFFIAGVASVFLVTIPTLKAASLVKLHPLKDWAQKLSEGFTMLFRLPLLFWFAIVAMGLNFVVSPLGIVLPVLVKEGRAMPAWFLGALQSSSSVGAILGALSVGFFVRRFKSDRVLAAGIVLIGIGVMMLPFTPNAALPTVMMFVIGAGSTLANVPISTQFALTIPNEYRSRLNSVIGFLCQAITPLSVALSGALISSIGLSKTLVAMGLVTVLLVPLLFIIPHFVEFMRLSASGAEGFLAKKYPKAFKHDPDNEIAAKSLG